MERRTLLGISGGALVASLSGCLQLETNDDDPDEGREDVDDESDDRDEPGDDEDDGIDEDEEDRGDEDDADDDGNDGNDGDDADDDDGGVTANPGSPEATVEAFIEALDAADVQRINHLLHPEGPMPEFTENDADDIEEIEYGLEETELLEQEDGEALVGATLTIDDGETEDVIDSEIALRTEDGEWRIWEIDPVNDDGPSAPAVSWSIEAEREGGEVVSVTFGHEGGDTVEVDELSIRAGPEVVAPPGDVRAVMAGDRIVVEFDGADGRIAAGEDVMLVWESDTAVLAHHTLDDPTGGAPADQFQVNP